MGSQRHQPSLLRSRTTEQRSSVEATFLSTFVLISQNRTAAAADKRADLDLQINLLAEHELTKLTEVVTPIAARLNVQPGADAEIEEIKEGRGA